MDDVNNTIRNKVREFVRANNYSFYDVKQHTGWLRNIMIRYCNTGELMVNVILNFDAEEERNKTAGFYTGNQSFDYHAVVYHQSQVE